jgi:hypothetical protein
MYICSSVHDVVRNSRQFLHRRQDARLHQHQHIQSISTLTPHCVNTQAIWFQPTSCRSKELSWQSPHRRSEGVYWSKSRILRPSSLDGLSKRRLGSPNKTSDSKFLLVKILDVKKSLTQRFETAKICDCQNSRLPEFGTARIRDCQNSGHAEFGTARIRDTQNSGQPEFGTRRICDTQTPRRTCQKKNIMINHEQSIENLS